MDRLLTSPHPHKRLQELADNGILKQFFPELDALRGVEQPERWHPEGDVFKHTLLMLSRMAWQSPLLGWCILLHDIGKKAAQTFDADGTPHFYGHEAVGADMCPAILERYGFDTETIRRIESAVRLHMSFTNLHLMRRKKLLRLLEREDFDLHLELHRLDCISCHAMMDCFVYLLDKLNEYADRLILPEPFINGNDLKRLGLTPGPHFRKILDAVFEEQLAGNITTREEALQKAMNFPDKR
jgi:poly(A) polymerase